MRHTQKRYAGSWPRLNTAAMLVCATLVMRPLWSAPRTDAPPPAFTVVGAQFHQRAPQDTGEARICLQNTGTGSLSPAQLKARVLVKKLTGSTMATTECPYVYAKLSPPVVRPDQYGEMVIKLREHPTGNGTLTCDVTAMDGTVFAAVPLAEAALWISYVGFSEDLRRACVYVENLAGEPAEARLTGIGPWDLVGRTRALHFPLPPRDKGCLIGEFPSPVTAGQFLHVALAAQVGGQKSRIDTVVRVIRAMPLLREAGTDDPALGLDAQSPFLQTMVCPAHAHGTHEAAAAQFLADYAQRFAGDPGRAIQMAICRNDMPRAWFRFGPLPDVAAVNTCLYPPAGYGNGSPQWASPFLYVGSLAKKATEPGRFLAIVPIGVDTETESFFHKKLTSQEWRYLVYSCVASGAKGVIYRSLPLSDPLNRDAFMQLNRELQYLRPLLSAAEPVEWVGTAESGYAARGLWCGDQALLVVVLDLRYFSRQKEGKLCTPPFGKAVVPVRLHVRTPAGIAVQEIRTPFATLAREDWDEHDGILDFTADMMESAQVYILSLRPPARLEGGPQP
jgi:hypothetical protein